MTTVNNQQATLALNQTIASEGLYPGSGGAQGLSIGAIRTYGFDFLPGASFDANGATIPIASHTALFSLLGTTFGGNGRTDFGLPDLESRLAVGQGTGPGLPHRAIGAGFGNDTVQLAKINNPVASGGNGQSFDNSQGSQAISYAINIGGNLPSSGGHGFIGQVSGFANSSAIGLPGGWVFAEGQLLSVATNPALFSILGNTYGGDGITTFALPDLRGRTIIGADGTLQRGQQIGDLNVSPTLSQMPTVFGGNGDAFNNIQPSLVLNFAIALAGLFPSPGSGIPDADQPYIGEIIAFTGSVVPAGYALVDGSLLAVQQNQSLYSLLGTTYGGDGVTTFALPDLRGRAVFDAGSGRIIGSVEGQNETTLLETDIVGPLIINGGVSADILNGTAGDDTINGLGNADTIGGRGGNDLIEGGDGDDILDGEGGDGDIASYAGAGSAVTVSLLLQGGIQATGGAGGDMLSGFEGLLGSDHNDTLTGDAVANTIDGGAGDDTMDGGIGNDVYTVDSAGDSVTERVGQGDDTINTSVSFDMPDFVERLMMSGSGNIQTNGNALANHIGGNSGDNYLNGAAGTDLMSGGGGNDTYAVDNSLDIVMENAGEGNDVVYSSVDITLSGNIETLILTGTAVQGFGQGDDNQIFGNAGVNVLFGQGGNDYLLGFGDDDIFVITPEAGAVDVIGDFMGAGVAGGDRIGIAGFGAGAVVYQVSQTSFEIRSADNSIIQQFVLQGHDGSALDAGDYYFA